MPRGLKKALILVGLSATLGLALVYLTGLGGYDPNGCSGCWAYGRPMLWTIQATGTGGYLSFGAIVFDFGFWFAISFAVVWVLPVALAKMIQQNPLQRQPPLYKEN